MNSTEQQLIAKAKSIKKQKEATEEKQYEMLTKKNTKSTRSLYKTLNSPKFKELNVQKNALRGQLTNTQKALNGDYELTGDDATELALDLLSFSEAGEKLAQGAQGAMDGSKAVYDVYNEETLPKKFQQAGQYAIENAIDALPGQADKLASAVYYPLKWAKN